MISPFMQMNARVRFLIMQLLGIRVNGFITELCADFTTLFARKNVIECGGLGYLRNNCVNKKNLIMVGSVL